MLESNLIIEYFPSGVLNVTHRKCVIINSGATQWLGG